jgi:acyl-CoA reductase-like NAD-dependent aldehyde dehydrogenase
MSSSAEILTTISPITLEPIRKTPATTASSLKTLIEAGYEAHLLFNYITTLGQRIAILSRFLDSLEARADDLALDLTEQMGRPIDYTAAEIKTAVKRGRFLICVAHEVLDPHREGGQFAAEPGFDRWIEKNPLGVIFVIIAWNYPYLILINSLIPALLAGNAILLKPSPQTPSIPKILIDLLVSSGVPHKLVQPVHSGDPELISKIISHPMVPHTVFTGSFEAGLSVARTSSAAEPTAANPGFKTYSLELGGNDAAYVRGDVDPKWAAAEILDGAVFNSGQSCCAIERVYVHKDVYDAFVKEIVEAAKKYVIGDPREKGTMLGPVVSAAAADRIRSHIDDAISKGARSLVPADTFASLASLPSTYVPPTILVNVNHKMRVMKEETFGPVVPIMKVNSDDQAVQLMNHSEYGLTASVWTKDEDIGRRFARLVEAGTVFVNRCDHPDPTLAWIGYKNSGKGHSLSRYGFDQFVRLKSYHVKKYSGSA